MANPQLAVRIAANLDELRQNILEGKNIIGEMTPAVEKMARDWTTHSQSMVDKAVNITAAMAEMKDGTELTARDAAAALKTLEQALAQLEATGRPVPPQMQATAEALQKQVDATKPAVEHTSLLSEGLTKLAAAFSIGSLIESVGAAVYEFAKSIPDAAINLVNLSDRTGLSIGYLDGLKEVAEKSGSTIDAFSQSIFRMGVNMEEGNSKTITGLNDLAVASGNSAVSFDALQVSGLSLEDKFRFIVSALASLDDQQKQNGIGQEIFGRQFRDMAAAVQNGTIVINENSKAFEDNARQVKEAHDRWVEIQNLAEQGGIGVLSDHMKLFNDVVGMSNILAFLAIKYFGDWTPKVTDLGRVTAQTAKDQAALNSELSGAQVLLGKLTDLHKLLEQAITPIPPLLLDAAKATINEGASAADVAKIIGAQYSPALKVLEEDHKRVTEETKKLTAAVNEVRSAGVTWQATVAALPPALVDTVEAMLRAGVSGSALAQVYRLTDAELKALTIDIRAQDEALKLHDGAIVSTGKLWEEYNALLIAHGGTATQAQLAQVKQWAETTKLAFKGSEADARAYYAAVDALAKEKTESILIDWAAIGRASKDTLQEAADKAAATYQYVLEHSDKFTQAQVDNFLKIAQVAQDTANDWGASFVENADKASGAIDKTVASAQKAVDAMTHAGGTVRGSMDSAAWAAYLDSLRAAGIFVASTIGAIGGGIPPGRAVGGPVDSGMPYVVGERGPELFVPSSSGAIVPNGAGGGASVTNNFHFPNYVGDRSELARAVGAAIMERSRDTGMRFPAGRS